MKQVKEFIENNFRSLIIVVSFVHDCAQLSHIVDTDFDSHDNLLPALEQESGSARAKGQRGGLSLRQ